MHSSRNRLSVLTPLIKCEEKDYSLIEDNIYISNRGFANNYSTLKSIGISLIIAVYPKDIKYCYLRPPECRFHHIEVNDAIHEDLISHFDDCFDLIDEELSQMEEKYWSFAEQDFQDLLPLFALFL